jgi:LCP family protein required for cell wall assembly
MGATFSKVEVLDGVEQLEHESELKQVVTNQEANEADQPSQASNSVASNSVAGQPLDLQSDSEEPEPGSATPKSPKFQSPKFNWSKWLFRGVALGCTATISAILGAVLVLMIPLPSSVAPKSSAGKTFSLNDLWRQGIRYHVTRPINILVMGIDRVFPDPNHPNEPIDVFSGRSDTMLLIRLNPETNSVSMLSIPRDTQVDIPNVGVAKINDANVEGGPTLAAKVVSSTLDGIPIDRYVRVSTGAFRELVDLLGGVKIFVPERMYHVDKTQKLMIDLQPGWQTLNGDQAEQFARFRNDENGDVGRVQRQQQMIRILREKLTNPAIIPHIPQILQLFQKYVDTNLSFEEMLALANFGLGLDQSQFRMVILPGRFSRPDEFVASYWIMNPAGRDQVLHEYFDMDSVAVLSKHSNGDLRIAVQNASSDPQLASQVVAYLQSKGFYNAYAVQDWPDHQAQTQIIAQQGDLESANLVGTVLGVGQVLPSSTGDLFSDLTIRVGDDWAQRPKI